MTYPDVHVGEWTLNEHTWDNYRHMRYKCDFNVDVDLEIMTIHPQRAMEKVKILLMETDKSTWDKRKIILEEFDTVAQARDFIKTFVHTNPVCLRTDDLLNPQKALGVL